MPTITVATFAFTAALSVGVIACLMIDRKVQAHGAASVTMADRGARLLMRTCPLLLAAATLVTLGTFIANA